MSAMAVDPIEGKDQASGGQGNAHRLEQHVDINHNISAA